MSRWRDRALTVVCVTVLLAGCASDNLSATSAAQATEQASAAPAAQLARGAELYQAHCARCHGEAGEGDVGPVLVGENYVFRSRQTAQGLFDYVSVAMPFDAPGTLSDQEYWDTLSWILDQNALLPAGTELTPENADEISVDP